MFPADLTARAAALLERCRGAGLKIATAESCTGGLVAGLLTEIPGSSAVVERGFVVYSNEAKAGPARRAGGDAASARRGQRGDRPGDGRRSAPGLARRYRGQRDRRRGTGRRHGGEAGRPRLVRLRGRGAATVAREERFGDIGRGKVRLASVGVALEMLEAAAAAGSGAILRDAMQRIAPQDEAMA